MTGTLIAILIPWSLGYLIVSIILRDEADLIERASLAYPVGAGFLTMEIFIAGILRIPLNIQYLLPPVLIEILLLLLLPKKMGRVPIFFRPSVPVIMLLGISLIKIASVFMMTYLRPIYAWDAWANWSAGAKLFYYTKSLMLDNPETFLGKGYLNRIISYPLHNPLMQTWIALFAGRFDEVLVKFWSPFYLLSMSAYLFWSVKKIWNELSASVVLLIFLSSPLLCYHSIEVYSDLALSACLFFAVSTSLKVMEGKDRYLPVLGIFIAHSLFVKDEALFFAIPLVGSLSLYLIKNQRFNTRNCLLFLVPFLYILPWYIFKFTNSLTVGAEYIRWYFVFQPESIIKALSDLLSLQNFNVVFVALVLLAIINGRAFRAQGYILFPLAFYFIFFLSLYTFTSYYYDYFMRGTVFFRNMLTLYPSALLLSVVYLKNLLSPLSQGAQDSN